MEKKNKPTKKKNKWKNNAWLSNLHITKTKILQNPEFFFPKNCFFFFLSYKGLPLFLPNWHAQKKGKERKKKQLAQEEEKCYLRLEIYDRN